MVLYTQSYKSRYHINTHIHGLPWWLSGKKPACQCRIGRRCGFDPWVRKTPGGGNGHPLQYSCLEQSTDRGAWRSTVHGATKSWTLLSAHIHMHVHTHTHVFPLQMPLGYLWVLIVAFNFYVTYAGLISIYLTKIQWGHRRKGATVLSGNQSPKPHLLPLIRFRLWPGISWSQPPCLWAGSRLHPPQPARISRSCSLWKVLERWVAGLSLQPIWVFNNPHCMEIFSPKLNGRHIGWRLFSIYGITLYHQIFFFSYSSIIIFRWAERTTNI